MRRARSVAAAPAVALGLVLALGGKAQGALTDGLVGHWQLDEGSGTVAADSSGNANDGTLVAGATWTAGVIGGGLGLEAGADYVDMGDIAVADFGTGDFTIGAWALMNTTTDETIVSKNEAEFNYGYALWVQASELKMELLETYEAKTTPPAAGEWHHVVGLRRGDVIELYVNGVLASTASGAGSADVSTAESFRIGVRTNGTSPGGVANDLHGLVDDVRIYNRALTAAEVGDLHGLAAGPAAPTITSAPLVSTNAGLPYSYTIVAWGNPAPTLSVAGLPVWLSFNGTDTIFGTPSAADLGPTGTITVTATNTQGTDSQEFVIDVLDSDPSLIGWWKLDETGGTAATDSSGNSYHGTLKNDATWTTGVIGGALALGTNGVMVLESATLGLSTEWTIAGWFTAPLPATGTWHTFTRGTDASGADHQVALDANLYLGCYDNAGPTGFNSCGFNLGGLSSGWHHVAATGSGATTSYYVDGVYVGVIAVKSTSDIWVVGSINSGAQIFADMIDDVRIYDRALSAAEIADLYNSGAAQAPAIAAHPADQTVAEGQSATFTVAATGPTPIWYQWQVFGGTAWQDITGAAESTHTKPATTLADDGDMYRCIVSNANGSVVSDDATLTVTPAGTTVVTITATDASASEAGPDTGRFTITRAGDTASPLTVNLALGGAAAPSDYTTSPDVPGGTVTFAAGASYVDVTVTPVDDIEGEGSETVAVTLVSGTGYSVGTPSTATVTIDDNDFLEPPGAFALLTPADQAAVPAGQALTFTWQASGSAETYALTMATDAGFDSPVVEAADLTATSHMLAAGTLAAGSTYYWRVVATNAVGSTACSAYFTFTVSGAEISADPAAVEFRAMAGMVSVVSRQLTVRYDGTLPSVAVSLTTTSDFPERLGVTPTSFQLSPGEEQAVTVSLDISALPRETSWSGRSVGTLTVNAPGAAGSPLDVELLATIDPSHIVTGCAYTGARGTGTWASVLLVCLLWGRMRTGRARKRRRLLPPLR